MADLSQENRPLDRLGQINPSEHGASRPERIHIYDVKELRYWTKTLGVSSDALVSAVRAVGNEPSKVTDFLQRQRAS